MNMALCWMSHVFPSGVFPECMADLSAEKIALPFLDFLLLLKRNLKSPVPYTYIYWSIQHLIFSCFTFFWTLQTPHSLYRWSLKRIRTNRKRRFLLGMLFLDHILLLLLLLCSGRCYISSPVSKTKSAVCRIVLTGAQASFWHPTDWAMSGVSECWRWGRTAGYGWGF